MKQIGIIMMILLSTLLVSAQQTDNGKPGKHQKSDQRSSVEKHQAEELTTLTQKLALTAEQQVSISKLQQNLNDATKAFRESKGSKADRKIKRQEMTKLRTGYDADIMALLTKKQKTKYQAILKAREAEMQRQSSLQGKQGNGQDNSVSNNDGGDE